MRKNQQWVQAQALAANAWPEVTDCPWPSNPGEYPFQVYGPNPPQPQTIPSSLRGGSGDQQSNENAQEQSSPFLVRL